MSEWKPIETAPRDGTNIILVDADNTPPCLVIGLWSDKLHTWIVKWDLDPFEGYDATHWMPLPLPPESNT
jgi:hypothetical protein